MTIVDAAALSLYIRRRPEATLSRAELAVRDEVALVTNTPSFRLLGVTRQELLTGLRDASQFERLRAILRTFADQQITIDDHERAAEFANDCRSRGVQGSPVDFLVCSVAHRIDAPILTTDADFRRFAAIVPVRLHPLSAPLS